LGIGCPANNLISGKYTVTKPPEPLEETETHRLVVPVKKKKNCVLKNYANDIIFRLAIFSAPKRVSLC
jgi:hypothetical protein